MKVLLPSIKGNGNFVMLALSKVRYAILGNGHILRNTNMTNIGEDTMLAILIRLSKKEAERPSIEDIGY